MKRSLLFFSLFFLISDACADHPELKPQSPRVEPDKPIELTQPIQTSGQVPIILLGFTEFKEDSLSGIFSKEIQSILQASNRNMSFNIENTNYSTPGNTGVILQTGGDRWATVIAWDKVEEKTRLFNNSVIIVYYPAFDEPPKNIQRDIKKFLKNEYKNPITKNFDPFYFALYPIRENKYKINQEYVANVNQIKELQELFKPKS